MRGRSAKVDASFADIVRESDTLLALMGDFEARSGPFSFYGDLAWTKISGVSTAPRYAPQAETPSFF